MFIDTRERPAGEVQQKVGRIKLSEAIRIGARIRPQCAFRWFTNGESCAQGAAYEAVFGHPPGDEYRGCNQDERSGEWLGCRMRDEFPSFGLVAETIQSRNDSGESRESIASWLEQHGL